MLRILETPDALRQPTTGYPAHSRGPNIEAAFYAYAREQQQQIQTDLIYLPIFWQNNYFALNKRTREIGYRGDPEAQLFLDQHLCRHETYFTVTQADEGTYERLPPNVLVFAGAGAGHIPIALVCDPHPLVEKDRNIVASFVGNINTGGPERVNGKPGQSSWDHNGAGARVRRRMQQALTGQPGYEIYDQIGTKQWALTMFQDVVRRSEFTLCPRGYGKTSFRMFEALQLGSIPVYISDEIWLPYTDVLDWNDFAVVVQENEIEQIPERLAALDPTERQRKRDRIAALWDAYFSPRGAAAQIIRYVESQ